MKEIKITKGYTVLVDDEDFDFINSFNWQVVKSSDKLYAKKAISKLGKGEEYIMHRLIMNTPKDMRCDHIDGNGLNNQKNNLRNCTYAENSRNRRKPRNTINNYKGVNKVREGKYRATIYCGRKIHIGYFSNEIDAAKAYDEKALELFSDFAFLNFPQETVKPL